MRAYGQFSDGQCGQGAGSSASRCLRGNFAETIARDVTGTKRRRRQTSGSGVFDCVERSERQGGKLPSQCTIAGGRERLEGGGASTRSNGPTGLEGHGGAWLERESGVGRGRESVVSWVRWSVRTGANSRNAYLGSHKWRGGKSSSGRGEAHVDGNDERSGSWLGKLGGRRSREIFIRIARQVNDFSSGQGSSAASGESMQATVPADPARAVDEPTPLLTSRPDGAIRRALFAPAAPSPPPKDPLCPPLSLAIEHRARGRQPASRQTASKVRPGSLPAALALSQPH